MLQSFVRRVARISTVINRRESGVAGGCLRSPLINNPIGAYNKPCVGKGGAFRVRIRSKNGICFLFLPRCLRLRCGESGGRGRWI